MRYSTLKRFVFSTACIGLAAACAQKGPIRRLASEDPVVRTSQGPREALLEAPVSDRYLQDDGTIVFRDTEFGYSNIENQTGALIGFRFVSEGKQAPDRSPASGSEQTFFREYAFEFPGRARQDLALRVSEYSDEAKEGRLETLLLFFPRKVVPSIRAVGANERWVITLPTREEIVFNAHTRTLESGVLEEGSPIDRHVDPKSRKFPDLRYVGRGLLVRAESRAQDPRTGTLARITKGRETCVVPSDALWDAQNALQFRFESDAAFEKFVERTCGFSFETNRAPASENETKAETKPGLKSAKKKRKTTPEQTEQAEQQHPFHDEPAGGVGM